MGYSDGSTDSDNASQADAPADGSTSIHACIIYRAYLEGEEEVREHGVDGAHGAERVQGVARLLARLVDLFLLGG